VPGAFPPNVKWPGPETDRLSLMLE